MDRSLIILLLFWSSCSFAQVLLPTPETAFSAQHNFNREFIREKEIRRITFEIIDKKDFEAPVDKSLTETYEFDQDGKLARHYYTSVARTLERQITTTSKKGKKTVQSVRTIKDYVYDTISTSYFYEGDKKVLQRYHDGREYYEARYYSYDTAGRLTKELRFKETNNSPYRGTFILGNQVQLSVDSFQYTLFSTGQLKCVFLNNENRPYKERITNFDSLGRTIVITENYTAASWIRQEQNFTYTEDKLISARFSGNSGNKLLMLHVYEYDAAGELYGEKQYKNDVLVKELSYVSDRVTNLLNSLVIRDHVNKTMRIIKLRYDLGIAGK